MSKIKDVDIETNPEKNNGGALLKVVQQFHKAGGTVFKLVGVQHLGQQLHARLDWSSSDDTMCRKGQSRRYFLR